MPSRRERLPARWLDIARTTRDIFSPMRRRAGHVQVSERDRELALQVSPNGQVLAGPFKGLLLPMTGSWGGHAARLAGAYEEEISGQVEAALASRPRQIVDAGAAEGYYAVGIARRLPKSQILAYDIDPEARRICGVTVSSNNVTNVSIRGRITPRELRRCLDPEALVLCDVEGYERDLLDPLAAPQLRTAWIIVELHEFAVPGVTRTVVTRFAGSHDVLLVDAELRSGTRSQLAHLDDPVAQECMREGRPHEPRMQWAIMRPKTNGRAP